MSPKVVSLAAHRAARKSRHTPKPFDPARFAAVSPRESLLDRLPPLADCLSFLVFCVAMLACWLVLPS